MAVTNGPSKEYMEQMKAYGKQQEAAAAAAAAQQGRAQKAQLQQAASMAQAVAKRNAQTGGTAAGTSYTYQPGSTMAGLSDATKEQLAKYQGGYTPSAAVIAAQNALAQIQNQKPQGYNSKYGAQLDSLLKQIQNPEGFKWDFNGDELFQTYADMYGRKGQQAMINAIGNAAALTGGYGNSYAEQVGQQTYDEYMNDLMSKALELRDRAYQIYQDKQNNLYNKYNALQNADQTDYGRHRDTVGDWQTLLDYYTGRADSERNFDYGTYADMLNYWMNVAGMENSDYWDYENLKWDKEKLALQLAAEAAAAAGTSGGGGGGGGGRGKSGSGESSENDGSAVVDALYKMVSNVGGGAAGLANLMGGNQVLSEAAADTSLPYKEYIFSNEWKNRFLSYIANSTHCLLKSIF